MPDPQPWALEYSPRAARALRKLDRVPAQQILNALERLAQTRDPTKPCKALSGPLTGLWPLRTGNYRIILDINPNQLTIIAIDLGHRSNIYD